MSTILTNITTIDECLNDSSIPQLKFITAGPIPPNPSELIMGSKLLEVLEYLKTKFDYVVVDNPPVGLVTDGLLNLTPCRLSYLRFQSRLFKEKFCANHRPFKKRKQYPTFINCIKWC